MYKTEIQEPHPKWWNYQLYTELVAECGTADPSDLHEKEAAA